RRAGMSPLPTGRGLELLDVVLAAGLPVASPMGLEPERIRAGDGPDFAILRKLVRTPVRRAARAGAGTVGGPVSLADQLAGRPAAEQLEHLLDLVASNVAEVLRHTGAGAIDPERSFKELGFDSLTAVELRNRLNTLTGLRLPATLVFDYPTPSDLAQYLLAEVGGAAEPAVAPVGSVLSELDRLESAIAGASPEGEEAARITNRLQAVLARWNEIQSTVLGAEHGNDDLESATADEILDIIQREFGGA
ncbi:phosphopantetheine-binding protein, partial [Kitasatospora sp. NPDC059648]|uniref:phosphopantetheine-binding protein n=1 Tax=Kitasatospora sp. NPDC059648 TaxID=3346894 RepID=UPI0036AF5F78